MKTYGISHVQWNEDHAKGRSQWQGRVAGGTFWGEEQKSWETIAMWPEEKPVICHLLPAEQPGLAQGHKMN